MSKKLLENIILVDKPKGITSFDVIRILRRELGIRKMGHAGTLDPLASGLMIIGINDGTKQMEEFLKLDKSYEAEILLGTKTDTGDLEGQVIETREITNIEEDYVEDVIRNFHGEFEIAVPKHSAIKKDGKALYEYAREGKEVKIPVKTMKIYKSVFRGIEETAEGFILKVTFDVASGVYIRSLVEYLGNFLDVPATLANLRRTKIGDFSLKGAKKLNLQGFSGPLKS
jgi:tRNA pseudouridine55 synthase